MSLSVVIVHYETPDLLEECLRSLGEAGRAADEILVVDNSRRRRARPATERFAGVRLLENPENLGFARAVNQGLAHTAGDWVLILNPDTRVLPGALEALLAFGAAHPEAGVLGPRLLNPDGTLQHSCRRFYTLRTLIYRRTFLARWVRNSRTVREHLMLDFDHAAPRAVDWVLGGAMLVRRRAVADVGGADERFFLYFEDVDWCYRMGKRGWKVWYVPSAQLEHRHRRESARDFRGLLRHLASSLRFWEKWSLVLYVAKRTQARARGLAAVVADVAAINLAFYLAFLSRAWLAFVLTKPLFPFGSYASFLLLINFVVVGTLLARGQYRPRTGDWARLLVDLGKSLAWAALIVMAATYVAYVKSYSRALVLLFFPYSVALVFLGRCLVEWATRAMGERLGGPPRALLVGVEPLLGEAARLLEAAEPAYEWCGVRNLEPGTRGASADERAEQVAGLVRDERAQVMVLAIPAARAGEFWPVAERCGASGVEVSVFTELTPWLRTGDRLGPIGPLTMVRTSAEMPLERSALARRLLELGVAVALLPPALLALALAWLGLLLGGRRPVWEREVWDNGRGERVAVRRLRSGRGSGGLVDRLALGRALLLWRVLTGRVGLVGGPLRPYAEGSAGGGRGASLPAGLTGLWYVEPRRQLSDLDLERWIRRSDLSTDLWVLVRTAARWAGRARPGAGEREGATP
ncbi:MAG TPA: glycosyltransferase [Candidatus Saccharimonadales bacterium]|nr:glycosyltransferase [Candidatus Saccharimonadales bacterium]